MTEIKIPSNAPSIANIQENIQANKLVLTDSDINRLFQIKPLPKFQLLQFKFHSSFMRKELAQFFINKLEKWNATIQQQGTNANNRTELALNQYLFSNLKRISLVNQNQIDWQLEQLYECYKLSTRIKTRKPQGMPKKINQNQSYEIQKTFKTNAPLLLNQYLRKTQFRFNNKLMNSQREQLSEINEAFTKKLNSMENNFVTDPEINKKSMFRNTLEKFQAKKQANNEKIYYQHSAKMQAQRQENKEKSDLIFKRSMSHKIKQDEIRKCRQMKQIQLEQQILKNRKARMVYEASKMFYQGSFDTATRAVKTSQGNRKSKTHKLLDDIKKMRIKTGWKKHRQHLAHSCTQEIPVPQVNQITAINLIKNPQQTKIKKKKKNIR